RVARHVDDAAAWKRKVVRHAPDLPLRYDGLETMPSHRYLATGASHRADGCNTSARSATGDSASRITRRPGLDRVRAVELIHAIATETDPAVQDRERPCVDDRGFLHDLEGMARFVPEQPHQLAAAVLRIEDPMRRYRWPPAALTNET